MKFKTIITLLCALLISSTLLRADYPIASHRYLADPSILVTQDRVYVYCSNDDESPVEGGYNIPNIVCISSSDMKNWTDHGVVFDAKRDTSWAVKSWAPAAIERDGKYFLYFGNSGANIGVVVADNPAGPFKDVRGEHLIDHSTPGVQPFKGGWLFDPGVYIDDDGQAYLYFGGNGDDKPRVVKLNRDMISLDGEVIKMTAPNFFEAAWVFKRNGTYYYSYSTTPKAEMRIDYMTSKDPITGFTYAGIVADQPPLNHNNNHSVQFDFKGHWYHVYHNRIVATQAGIPTGFRRNIAVESFGFNPDGSIQKVEYTTDGVAQLEHLNPYQRVEAETFYRQYGIETESCIEGGMAVTSINNGDWIEVAGVNFGTEGAYSFTAMVASENQGGMIELRLDSADGEIIGTCPVLNTGDLNNWKPMNCKLERVQGVHNLFLIFKTCDAEDFKFDYWSIK